MSREEGGRRLSPSRRRASRLPKFASSAQSKTALSTSLFVPAKHTKNTVTLSPLASSQSSRTLRESAVNRTLPTSQDPLSSTHYRSPFKQEVKDKPKDPPDTDPEDITRLWNLVAETILVPTAMEMANTVDVPAGENFLDAQHFDYPIVQRIFNQYGITIADDANQDIWTVLPEIKSKTEAQVVGRNTEDISGANALVSSNEITLKIDNYWVEVGAKEIGNYTQNTTGNKASDLLTEILPRINYLEVHRAIKVELKGPICDMREVLRNYILLGRQLEKGKGAVLARVSASEFSLKDKRHRVETFQLPPPIGQISVSQNIASRLPLAAATSASRTTTRSYKINSNSEPKPGHPASQELLAKADKSTLIEHSMDSQLTASIPSLPLPSGLLDFQYALDPNKIFETADSSDISGCTFVTDYEVATCPFFSIVFDEFSPNATADSSKRTSFLKAKFAVLAASALWNRLRLRGKSGISKTGKDIDVSQSKILHFGLTVTCSHYTFLVAKINTGDSEKGSNWTGCRITTYHEGFLRNPEQVKQLYKFVDQVLVWGSSTWKDEVKKDLALLLADSELSLENLVLF